MTKAYWGPKLGRLPTRYLDLEKGTRRGLMRGDAVTIVMGLAANDAIYMLADSRITWTNERDEVSNTRDVCQKLFQAKVGWCLLGWAGHLCLGRDLVRATFNRLNATDPLHPDWLRSDDAIRKLIRDCRALHAEGRPNHKACRQQAVQLMIGWMDYGRNPFTQSTELLSISSPSMAIQRTEFGVDIIGSGDKILDRMRFESFIDIISRYQDEPAGDIKREFYAAGEAAKHLRQTRVLTVGGLFQIAVLSSKGSQLLDHFQLLPIGEARLGTHVAMRTRAGMWVQEHRPTGWLTKIVSPFDIELGGPQSRERRFFEPATILSRNSPGVVPFTSRFVLEFCPYDPANVPTEVKRSWGDAPLEPLSWAQGSPPKRWRR